jgi:hypothetical protein
MLDQSSDFRHVIIRSVGLVAHSSSLAHRVGLMVVQAVALRMELLMTTTCTTNSYCWSVSRVWDVAQMY